MVTAFFMYDNVSLARPDGQNRRPHPADDAYTVFDEIACPVKSYMSISNTDHLAFFCHSRSTVKGSPPAAAKNRKTKQYKTANSPRLSNGQKPREA
jgi:hypothetical protein